MCVSVPIPFVQILLGNLWRAIQFTSLICTSERLLPLFLSPLRRRWSIASTQNVCIVPITHGLPLGFIKLRSISSPLTLTDQSVTLLGGTIALGLKCSGITLSPEWLDGLLDVCISSNPLHTRLLNQLIWWHVGRTQVSLLCEKKYCLYLFQFSCGYPWLDLHFDKFSFDTYWSLWNNLTWRDNRLDSLKYSGSNYIAWSFHEDVCIRSNF